MGGVVLTRVLAGVLGCLAGGLVGALLAVATGFRPLFHIGLIGGGALAVAWAEREPRRVSSNAECDSFEDAQSQNDWEDEPAWSRLRSDRLDGWWMAMIWATVLVPFAGPWVAVAVSSAAYYWWRADYPRKAAAVNRHGWLAWLAGNVLWLGLLWVASRFLVWPAE
jgi:hypothetical protein